MKHALLALTLLMLAGCAKSSRATSDKVGPAPASAAKAKVRKPTIDLKEVRRQLDEIEAEVVRYLNSKPAGK